MNWKLVFNKIVAFIRNNTSFSTIILIIIILTGLYYRHQIFQAGKEMGTGTVRSLQGFPVKDMADVQKAVKENKKFTYIESDTGDSILVATSRPIPEVEKDKSKLKFVGAVAFEGMDVGGAYEIGSVAGFNFDCPILLTRSFGAGVSKDFTDNFFAGGGAFVPYDVKNSEDAKERTELKIYGGWRF